MVTFTIIIACCFLGAAILYLLMIMPRMTGKAEIAPFVKVLYAHRGLHDNESDVPENSLAAFRKAAEGGYGIEMDVQLTKDRVPVVFHDYTLKRMCGAEGRVCDFDFAKLQEFQLCSSGERIPKLEEVLKLVDGRVPLIVEYKIEATDATVCDLADALLREYKGVYCIESFNPVALIWYRRNRPEIMRGQLSDAFFSRGEVKGALYLLLENLLLNFLAKPDFVAYNHRAHGKLSRRLCRGLFHNTAVAWTIKSETELEEAKKHFDIYIFDSFIPEEGSHAAL